MTRSSVHIVATDAGAEFWDDATGLRAALAEAVPRIPPVFGYDELGSRLFEEITALPTYYLTRVEWALLRRYAGEIADALAADRIAELGSGSAKKTAVLLTACVARRPTTYLPVDVSREMLETSGAALAGALPGLSVTGLWGRYEQGLAHLRAEPPAGRLVVAFLGSNLGNTTPDERSALLGDIAATLRPGDGFLFSVDLRKPAHVLETAYNDPPGHRAFAPFRLNHLTHLNRRFGGDFDIARYTPRAHFDEPTGVVEGHLYADSDQVATLPDLGVEVRVPRGGSINVGFSAKFDPDGLRAEVGAHGMTVEREWLDPDLPYAILLAGRA